MPEPSPIKRKRRGRLLRTGAAFLVLFAVAGYLAVQYVTGGTGAPGCKAVSAKDDGATYEFSPEQAVNAATITAVGIARGMPERAVTIALATALQESALRNLDHGDRDSLGLFQQRPSMGWGTEEQIMDPSYAAGMFYDHLAEVPGYTRLPLTVAAQRVQRSGFPQAYAKHEPDATLLAAALTGRAGATLTCDGRPAATQAAGPQAVRSALVRDFGRDALEETAAEVGGKGGGDGDGSVEFAAETSGRTVTVPVSADTNAVAGRTVEQRGWQLAHWAVANASALHIRSVSYAGREWTAGNTDSRWRATGTTEATDAKGSGGTGGAAGAVRIVTGQ
ncbi:heavy metal transporter [Streptomyces sp. B93]|uniref:heavy metal transporter n=1 Tax=Streptomyces sp. B93 TaxID=2824875 RepID=UPI001B38C160|nr:heavy metal transporter [Streptomyces sp. B93]MBQ1091673.1 heavy metal transporter [Streptomyces sp. B93]